MYIYSFVASLTGIGGPWLLLENMNGGKFWKHSASDEGSDFSSSEVARTLRWPPTCGTDSPGPTLEAGRLRTTTGSPAAARAARDDGDGFFEHCKRPNV